MKKKAISIVLFALCAVLLVASICGYIMRGTAATKENLDKMRTYAVLNAASNGLIEKIASNASADKLKEIRKDPAFRTWGQAEVQRRTEEAAELAREEAKVKYGNIYGADTSALDVKVKAFEKTLTEYGAAEDKAREAYADLYLELSDSVGSWTELIGENDDCVWSELCGKLNALENMPEYKEPFVKMARNRAEEEAKAAAKAAESTEEVTEEAPAGETVNYDYFVSTEEMAALKSVSDAALDELWSELIVIIPDLETADKKMVNSIKDSVTGIVASAGEGFSVRYDMYAAQDAETVLEGGARFKMKIASQAETLLIAFVALVLFTLVYTFWKPLTQKMGVPRTIILLFFIYLCLISRLYGMNVPNMFSNVLERVGMYGILVLAMLPGIQCGIGLNMGMTLGCIAGLFSIIVTLQYNMTGMSALLFACVLGALVAIPLGWAYSLLLNKMKGSEMTISTYVGYSVVSLMCIGWLLLPFYNPKIVFPLRGSGMRVTHSLLGSYAHLLDELWSFRILGTKVPTGIILFFLLMCLMMWLFSRSKVGIAMSAVGSNPRFAEASGINVDSMRTLGTILSMCIAAVGIVVYSSAFGYAQLYNAPKQLGFLTASAILIGGASVGKAKVSNVIIGVFLFEGVLTLGQQVANAVVAGGGLSEVMRIMISNGIILYALTKSGGDTRG